MSVEKAKIYLEQLRKLDDEIDTKENIKQQMRSRLHSVGASQLRDINVQGGKQVTGEDRIVRYMEYAEEIDEMIDRLAEHKMEVIREINELEERVDRIILFERYVNNEDWETVAESVCYEKKYTMKLHNDALRAFANKHTKKGRKRMRS